VCDSDLFFDFDIGSPEPAEVDEVDHVINEADDGMQLLTLGKVSMALKAIFLFHL